MGLDVYLYRCTDLEAAAAAEAEFSRRSEAIWDEGGKKYEDLTTSERDDRRARCKTIAAELDCDEWGEPNAYTKIDQPSAKYPEHLFRVGYFRSSYNESGINNILRENGQPTLDGIFAHEGETRETRTDWVASRERCEKTIAALRALADTGAALQVTDLSLRYFEAGPTSAKAAIALVQKHRAERAEHPSPFGGHAYSGREGIFHLGEPLQIVAAMPGKASRFFTDAEPCVWLAYRVDLSSYIQSLEIVTETIDWVLAQPDPQTYLLRWSG